MNKKSSYNALLAILLGVFVFRISSFAISLLYIVLQKAPFGVMAFIHRLDYVIIPFLSVAIVVLAVRLHGNRSFNSPAKAIAIFILYLVLACIPLRFEVIAHPVMVSPLQIAMSSNYNLATIEMLIDRYPEQINGRDVSWDHFCPLVDASLNQNTNVVALLVSKGADVDLAIEQLQQFNDENALQLILSINEK